MKLMVTGATGFVGQATVDFLLSSGSSVIAVVRKHSDLLPDLVEQVVVGDLSHLTEADSSTSISVQDDVAFGSEKSSAMHQYDKLSVRNDIIKALHEVEVVIYTAARVHMMNDDSDDPLVEFRKVNRDATLALAQLAADAGVKRFVFLSSIKVNGEMTKPGHLFTPSDKHVPTDPYGLSKYEAEQGLLALAEVTGMDVVIIRPPLVYGPGVRANFASIMKIINMGLPLPFGAVNNKRSLVALDNLVSFIVYCSNVSKAPQAANQIFLISDDEDVSTTELLKRIAKAFNKKSILFPVPVWFMSVVIKLIGKGALVTRLFGSLQVDASKARNLLGWHPVISMDGQLAKTANAYLERIDD